MWFCISRQFIWLMLFFKKIFISQSELKLRHAERVAVWGENVYRYLVLSILCLQFEWKKLTWSLIVHFKIEN